MDSVEYVASLVTTGQEVLGWTPGALVTAEQCRGLCRNLEVDPRERPAVLSFALM